MKRKKIIRGTTKRPRLSVYRSSRTTYAQVIDDERGVTLVAASDKDLDQAKTAKVRKTKTEKARLIGEILAQKALTKKIKTVVFDRGRHRYHGRVKALAEGARKEGLVF